MWVSVCDVWYAHQLLLLSTAPTSLKSLQHLLFQFSFTRLRAIPLSCNVFANTSYSTIYQHLSCFTTYYTSDPAKVTCPRKGHPGAKPPHTFHAIQGGYSPRLRGPMNMADSVQTAIVDALAPVAHVPARLAGLQRIHGFDQMFLIGCAAGPDILPQKALRRGPAPLMTGVIEGAARKHLKCVPGLCVADVSPATPTDQLQVNLHRIVTGAQFKLPEQRYIHWSNVPHGLPCMPARHEIRSASVHDAPRQPRRRLRRWAAAIRGGQCNAGLRGHLAAEVW